MNERILLCEGNTALRGNYMRHFTGNHYEVLCAESDRALDEEIRRVSPDLVILDSDLCRFGGDNACREIRKSSSVPIILTSTEYRRDDAVRERVRGLESGADDFVTKPCDVRELLARAKAVMRRGKTAESRPSERNVLHYDAFDLSLDRYELFLAGKKVDLTPKELQLLYFLASNPNRVYTRDQLLDNVWGYNYLGNTRTIDAHIRKLRYKCDGVSDRWSLRTVWGVGYKFELQ